MESFTSKNKLKVALVNLHWISERMGGVEKSAKELLNLLGKDVDFTVLSGYYKVKPNISTRNYLFKYCFGDSLLKFIQFFLKSKLILSRINVDIVHGKYISGPIKHPYLLEIHQPFFSKNDSLVVNNFIYRIIQRKALNAADAILVHSLVVKNWLVDKKKVESTKIHVIPYGKDRNIYRPSIKRRGDFRQFLNIQEKFVFFYPGRIVPLKNQMILFDIFEKIDRKLREKMFFIISGSVEDQNYFNKLQQRAATHKQHFLISSQYDEILKYYDTSDCVISTSAHQETFGQILIEAMAMGKPLILPKTKVFQEVGQDAALYYNPKDKQSLINAVQNIATDLKLRDNLIQKGNKLYCTRYTSEAYMNSIMKLYKSMKNISRK